MNPRVSVIIPTHDRPHMLKNAIASVLNQTFRDFEIIVIGNGSGPETERTIADLDSDKIRFLWHPVNKTVGAARNVGIKAARGRYIAFLDDDDLWMPRKLERQVPFLEEDSADIVYGRARIELKSPRELPNLPATSGTELIKPEFLALMKHPIIPCLTTLTKREVIAHVGFLNESEDMLGADDYELWLRIALFGFRFHFVDEILAIYTVHDSQYQGFRRPSPKLFSAMTRIVQRHPDQIRKYNALVRQADGGRLNDVEDLLLSLLNEEVDGYLVAGRRRAALSLCFRVVHDRPRVLRNPRLLKPVFKILLARIIREKGFRIMRAKWKALGLGSRNG